MVALQQETDKAILAQNAHHYESKHILAQVLQDHQAMQESFVRSRDANIRMDEEIRYLTGQHDTDQKALQDALSQRDQALRDKNRLLQEHEKVHESYKPLKAALTEAQLNIATLASDRSRLHEETLSLSTALQKATYHSNQLESRVLTISAECEVTIAAKEKAHEAALASLRQEYGARIAEFEYRRDIQTAALQELQAEVLRLRETQQPLIPLAATVATPIPRQDAATSTDAIIPSAPPSPDQIPLEIVTDESQRSQTAPLLSPTLNILQIACTAIGSTSLPNMTTSTHMTPLATWSQATQTDTPAAQPSSSRSHSALGAIGLYVDIRSNPPDATTRWLDETAGTSNNNYLFDALLRSHNLPHS